MANNILNEGRDTLLKIFDEVKDLNQNELREKELVAAEDSTERALADKEKAIAREIADTTKKRRDEIIKTFDTEEDKLNSLLKRTSQKREKYREGKVSERISAETAEFYEANEQIKAETKKLYKQNKTPGFFNSGIFYTLFTPGSLGDFLCCLLTFVFFFAVIPALIWYFLPKPVTTATIGLIYVACILVFGGIYMIIFRTAGTKYRETIAVGKNARRKIINNLKVIAKIKKSIRKDKDDTQYGLEDYNAQIDDIKLQLDDLAAKRVEALKVFDESTRQVITDEIKNTHQAEVDAYKSRLSGVITDLSGIRDYIKQRRLYIAENYEVFLGKEYVDADALKNLVDISEKNPNATIAEVIELSKQTVSEN